MLGLLDYDKKKLVESLWATNEGSVQECWENMKGNRYHTDRIARQIEYTDYVMTYKYLNALLAEATMVDAVCPNPQNQLSRVIGGAHLREMRDIINKMVTVDESVNDTLEQSMIKLLECKKQFLTRYTVFLDCMDDLSLSVRQKVQVIEGKGTYIHSSCYLGTGDNTILILQQRITDKEVFFVYV